MSEISRWVMTVCSAVLICGLVSVLIPSSSMEKIMNVVLGLFLLCCFLLPTGIDFTDFQLSLDSPEEIRQEVAEETADYFKNSLLESSEEKISSIIYQQAGKYGIKEDEILIYIDTEEPLQEEGSERMVVTIHLPQRAKDSRDAIQKALEDELGITVRLEYIEEEL